MNSSTPRKSNRHKRHSSNLIAAVSDYDSDLAAAPSTSASAAPTQRYEPPPPRTNTEINMSVIRRYLPSIHAILSIAANAVVYTFDRAANSWEKSGVEGPLFVCSHRRPAAAAAAAWGGSNDYYSDDDDADDDDDGLGGITSSSRACCIFVLNRRGLGNVIIDLARVGHVEISGELVILGVEDADDRDPGKRVLGLWIHNDREETREVNAAMIQRCWEAVRPAGPVPVPVPVPVETQRHDAGPAMQAIGRSLTLNELFASQEAASQGR